MYRPIGAIARAAALIYLRRCAARHGVIRFQHLRKISSILIRNTVVPRAIRTTPGSRSLTEGVKSPKTRSCYECHRWTFKDGANGGRLLDFP